MGDRLVFAEFNPEHIIDPKELVLDRVICGVDFGWHFGALVVAGLQNNVMYILETYAYKEKQLSEWIGILQDVRERYKDIFSNIICDSAEPRSIEQIKNAGLPAIAVEKTQDSIKNGIQLIKKRLTNKGLYIFKDAKKSYCNKLDQDKVPTTLPDEMYSYEYDLDNEKPIAKNNHLCDSLRYVCLTIDKQGNYDFIISGDDDELPDDEIWQALSGTPYRESI